MTSSRVTPHDFPLKMTASAVPYPTDSFEDYDMGSLASSLVYMMRYRMLAFRTSEICHFLCSCAIQWERAVLSVNPPIPSESRTTEYAPAHRANAIGRIPRRTPMSSGTGHRRPPELAHP